MTVGTLDRAAQAISQLRTEIRTAVELFDGARSSAAAGHHSMAKTVRSCAANRLQKAIAKTMSTPVRFTPSQLQTIARLMSEGRDAEATAVC